MKKLPCFYVPAGAIDENLNMYEKDLGRIPTCKEFRKKFPQDYRTVIMGLYHNKISTYTGLLRHLNKKVNNNGKGYFKEHPGLVKKAYYDCKKRHEEDGKNVTKALFSEECCGEAKAIFTGQYDANIKTWNEFLKSIGEPILMDRSGNGERREYKRKPRPSESKMLKEWPFESFCDAYEIMRRDYRGPVPAQRFFSHYGGCLKKVMMMRGFHPEIHDYPELVEFMEKKLSGLEARL